MSDMKKLLSILTESSSASGSVASVSSPVGTSPLKRSADTIFAENSIEECGDSMQSSNSPANFGLWKNSKLIAQEQVGKHGRKKTAVNKTEMYPQLAEAAERGQQEIDSLRRSRLERERGETGVDPEPSMDQARQQFMPVWHFTADGEPLKKNGEVYYARDKQDVDRVLKFLRNKAAATGNSNVEFAVVTGEPKLTEASYKEPKDMEDWSEEEWDAWDKKMKSVGKKAKSQDEKKSDDKKDVSESYDDYGDEEESELHSGCYVRDKQDPRGEVFIMRGSPEDRRVNIEDKNGSGWNISPDRLIAVDDNDPGIRKYFGQDMSEGKGLWANIHAKRERGGKMRKPGSKGAPTDADFKAASGKKQTDEGFGGRVDTPVSQAITRRIINQYPGLLKYGPDKVMAAIDEVSEWHKVGPGDEIGSSDVSAWVKEVARYLQTGAGEGIAESSEVTEEMIADRLKNELALFKSGTKSESKDISKKPADKEVQKKRNSLDITKQKKSK